MLKTSQLKVDAKRIKNINLKVALADDFTHQETFGLAEPFDTIYFSYSISMIPTWKESIANGLKNLKSGRSFYIVDFYDQKDLPKAFQKIQAQHQHQARAAHREPDHAKPCAPFWACPRAPPRKSSRA